MSSDGGELCSARCAEQPFDVAFHPGNNGIFVSGLITGAVSTRRRRLRPIFAWYGDMSMIEHFWQSFTSNANCNLHVMLHHGRNAHHIAECVFKATARAVRMAIESDPRQGSIPSTKGVL